MKEQLIDTVSKMIRDDSQRNLTRLRKALKLTQEELARELSISYTTVSSNEVGRNRPFKAYAKSYAKFFVEKFVEKKLDIMEVLR